MKLHFKLIKTDEEYEKIESWLTKEDKKNLDFLPQYLTWKEIVKKGQLQEESNNGVIFNSYIFTENEKPVAALNLKQVNDVLYFSQLVVNPKERGRGIGTKIVQEFIKNSHFFGYSARIVKTDVPFENRQAMKFFEKNGFKRVDIDNMCVNFEFRGQDFGFNPWF